MLEIVSYLVQHSIIFDSSVQKIQMPQVADKIETAKITTIKALDDLEFVLRPNGFDARITDTDTSVTTIILGKLEHHSMHKH